jgi:hypothetical protein
MKNKRSSWKSYARLQELARGPLSEKEYEENPFKLKLVGVTDCSETTENIKTGYVVMTTPSQIVMSKMIKSYRQYLQVFGGYTKLRYSRRRGLRGLDKYKRMRFGL